MGEKKRAAVYIRTSQERTDANDKVRDERLSPRQQSVDGKNECIKRGYEWVGEYQDLDRKGSLPPTRDLPKGSRKKSRESLSRMLDDIAAGKIDIVVCVLIDRLTRLKAEDGLKLFSFFNEHNVEVITYADNLPTNIRSPAGKMQLTMLIGFAEMESEMKSLRILMAKGLAKDEGRKLCSARLLGYANGAKKGTIVKSKHAPVAVEMFERFSGGESISSICNWLNDEHDDAHTMGGKVWRVTNVRNMLSNSSYIGQGFNSEDKATDNSYPAIISVKVFEECQRKIKTTRGTRTGRRYKAHTFGGLIRCSGCGETLKLKPNKMKVNYFVCLNRNCTRKPLGVQESHYETMGEAVLARVIPEKKTIAGSLDAKDVAQITKLEINLDKLQKQVGKGLLDADEYLVMKVGIKRSLAELYAKQKASENISRIEWGKSDALARRYYLKDLTKSIEMYPNGLLVTFSVNIELPFESGEAATLDKVWLPILQVPSSTGNNKRVQAFLPLNSDKLWVGYRHYLVDGEMVLGPDWDDVDPSDAITIGQKVCRCCNKCFSREQFKRLGNGALGHICNDCRKAKGID